MKRIEVTVPASAESEVVSFTAHLVHIASQFISDMVIMDARNSIDLKSVMGMMTIVISAGKTFTIEISGCDEDAAAAAIERYFA